jgi:hypothetical protein
MLAALEGHGLFFAHHRLLRDERPSMMEGFSKEQADEKRAPGE